MGDRFYEQQKKYKPKRRLKADIVADIETFLGYEVPGLEKCTIATLNKLFDSIQRRVLDGN